MPASSSSAILLMVSAKSSYPPESAHCAPILFKAATAQAQPSRDRFFSVVFPVSVELPVALPPLVLFGLVQSYLVLLSPFQYRHSLFRLFLRILVLFFDFH